MRYDVLFHIQVKRIPDLWALELRWLVLLLLPLLLPFPNPWSLMLRLERKNYLVSGGDGDKFNYVYWDNRVRFIFPDDIPIQDPHQQENADGLGAISEEKEESSTPEIHPRRSLPKMAASFGKKTKEKIAIAVKSGSVSSIKSKWCSEKVLISTMRYSTLYSCDSQKTTRLFDCFRLKFPSVLQTWKLLVFFWLSSGTYGFSIFLKIYSIITKNVERMAIFGWSRNRVFFDVLESRLVG